MPAFDNSPWVGSREVRPTDAQLTEIEKMDTALGAIGMARLWRHTGMFVLQLAIFTPPNSSTGYSLVYTAPVPFKVVEAQVGCESAAGSAATGDVQKKPAGGAFATMSTGAVDIKTGAGTLQPLPILDGSEDVDEGDVLRVACVGTGSGDVVGAQAYLTCFRR